jgi:CRISPR system Cascade subunit CasC
MVTGDVLARCDAAVHVAHAFTVHPGAFETDYFSALDDLQPRAETGSALIDTAELTTGLYYGYVVVDLPLLVSNLEGCRRQDWASADRSLGAEVVRRLVHLIATVSPGAKQGSTAPYAVALAVLAETGNAQPRTLANAFLDAVTGSKSFLASAQSRLAAHLGGLDAMYGRSTMRRLAAIEPPEELLAAAGIRVSLPELARWASSEVTAA